jgi:hypothetical protein
MWSTLFGGAVLISSASVRQRGLLEALAPKADVKKVEVWKDETGRKLARVERGDQRTNPCRP